MDLHLGGKTVLITGGSRGIGLACAEVMACEGCRVAFLASERAQMRNGLTITVDGGWSRGIYP